MFEMVANGFLALALALWIVLLVKARRESVKECDCTSRDPRRCMQDQCYDLDEPDHDKDECQVCAIPCMCECHSGRRRKDR